MILVFGGQGQVGRQLAENAAAVGVPLTAIGRSEADIADRAAVQEAIARIQPTAVINAAAYNQVDKAESEPQAAGSINATAPGIIASAAADRGIPVIHISTDYVFDGRKGSAYTEDDAVSPLSVYGRSKEAGEQAVRAANPQHVILRTAWVCGVHRANLLKTMLRMADEGRELAFVSDQVSSPTASADHADGLLVAAQIAASGDAAWGTYHLAGGGVASRYEIAEVVLAERQRVTGDLPQLRAVPAATFTTPAARPAFSALDSSRFADTFGFRMRPWREAVADAVADFFARGGTA